MNWPNNTAILRDSGITAIYPSQTMDDAARRGRLVSAASHLLASRKQIDPAWLTRHDECAPYLDALNEFFERHDFVLWDAEKEVRCEVERYLTHPDWIGLLDGVPADVEIKTGESPQTWWPLQTGGQLYALRSIKYPSADKMIRVVLQLARGQFKLHYHTDPRDMSEFIILVRSYWVKQKYVAEGL
jgi:hypothetical protein